MDALLHSLAHPTRLRLIGMLQVDGPQPQKQLAARLERYEGTVSKHMKILVEAGVVERESARGACRLPFPDETIAMLQAASALERAVAARRMEQAEKGAEFVEAMAEGRKPAGAVDPS